MEECNHIYDVEIGERVGKDVMAAFKERLKTNKPKKKKKGKKKSKKKK
jgi:hypothetical protein